MAADKENVAAIMKAKQAAGKQPYRSYVCGTSLTIPQLRLRRLRPPPPARSKALSLSLHVSVVGIGWEMFTREPMRRELCIVESFTLE
jgi:hypothetical protein